MADPTDRQRAEAKARSLRAGFITSLRPADDVAAIADALLLFRREGWEAGREAAANVRYVSSGIVRALSPRAQAAIRALPAPEEK